jgi:hypothetical protein
MILAAGCAAATAFNETWRNPTLAPRPIDGRKVIALVISADETIRRDAENTLAAQITAKGGQGIPGWTILPTGETKSEDKARAAIAGSGAVAVVTMEVVDPGQPSAVPGVRVGMRWTDHGSFWPHYRHAWGIAWSGAPPPRTNVLVETAIHALDPDELLWAGRSKSRNVESVDALFAQVASEAAAEVGRAGLITSSAR